MLAGCKLEYTLDLLSINYRDTIGSTFPTQTTGDERKEARVRQMSQIAIWENDGKVKPCPSPEHLPKDSSLPLHFPMTPDIQIPRDHNYVPRETRPQNQTTRALSWPRLSEQVGVRNPLLRRLLWDLQLLGLLFLWRRVVPILDRERVLEWGCHEWFLVGESGTYTWKLNIHMQRSGYCSPVITICRPSNNNLLLKSFISDLKQISSSTRFPHVTTLPRYGICLLPKFIYQRSPEPHPRRPQ